MLLKKIEDFSYMFYQYIVSATVVAMAGLNVHVMAVSKVQSRFTMLKKTPKTVVLF